MSHNTYDVGDLIRCTGTFTDASGTAVDPTTVTFKFRNPSKVTITYVYGTDVELVKSATGIYYVDLSLTDNGLWIYRFEGTGTGQAAGEKIIGAIEASI